RWRELEAANPLRAEGDPRVRIPPSWFGYVPYAVPVHHLRRLIRMRRWGEAGDPDEVDTDEMDDAEEASNEAGAARRRPRRKVSRRRAHRTLDQAPASASAAAAVM